VFSLIAAEGLGGQVCRLCIKMMVLLQEICAQWQGVVCGFYGVGLAVYGLAYTGFLNCTACVWVGWKLFEIMRSAAAVG